MISKFTRKFFKFFFVFSLCFLVKLNSVSAQTCDNPSGTLVSNISNFSATLSWDYDSSAQYYRVRYKELGGTSWLFKNGLISPTTDLTNLTSTTNYVWQVRSFCSNGNNNNSGWSVLDTFTTANFQVDCYNTPNGNAFIDNCGNCVAGLTGDLPCIAFSPYVEVSLSTLQCDSISDILFFTSQDPNEPDISSSIFSSDAGSFDFSTVSTNDTIGSSTIIAGGGYINLNTTLLVDFIITTNKISVKAVDNISGTIYGTFTIENSAGGILIVATGAGDNNNVTSGNSQTILLEGLFVTPNIPTAINFSSNITSELGDVDLQTTLKNIQCIDCNGDLGGSAYIDSCGNCVGGNTGDSPCIPFSPTVSVILSNTDCDSLTNLTIIVSQDPNEPDMSTSLFASNLGSFAISSMSQT